MTTLESVLTQVDWWWAAIFRRRLEGLTDEELWWEPAPDCWTLRPSQDGAYRYEWPPGSRGESAPPFTTMAWRLCHLAIPCLANWTLSMEGDSSARDRIGDMPFPDSADDVVEFLDTWWRRWRAAAGSLSDEDLWKPLADSVMGVDAPVMRLGPQDPFLHHLLHQHREFIHHGAEVNLLRDLFRAREGGHA